MYHALALAIAPNSALYQTRVGELSMWKGCAGPNGARNGLFAALLAKEGMTGPSEIIEGARGMMKQLTGPFTMDAPFGGNGHSFKVEETYFKYRPVMYPCLLPAEVGLELRKQLDINEIASIKVYLDAFAVMSSDGPDRNKPYAERYDPHSRETADHSIPYIVVAAIVDGEISDKTFTAERYRDPIILGLLKNTTLVEDPEYSREWPKTFNCRVEVTGKSGKKRVQHLKNPKGHPANPMSDSEMEEKFLKLSKDALTPEQAEAALKLLWRVEEVEDVGQIFEAVLVRPSGNPGA
jgi:2-methylcitrate dehydratase